MSHAKISQPVAYPLTPSGKKLKFFANLSIRNVERSPVKAELPTEKQRNEVRADVSYVFWLQVDTHEVNQTQKMASMQENLLKVKN